MSTAIPFGDLSRVYRRHQQDIEAAMLRVLERGWFVLGEELERFEADFAAACGAAHAIGVGNGTDAITLTLMAAGIGPGDEVVTTPLSAAFTALGIVAAGATPVFADVDPSDLNLDPDAAAAAITPRTRALLPVHLYGSPADMPRFRALADRAGLLLIEDAAQAHGASLGGRPIGGLGEAATFSFYPSKNLGAFGDAGAVVTVDPNLARRIRLLRDGGQSARYRHDIKGINSRLDELQAALLSVRLRHLEADNARRRAIAARYDAALDGMPDPRPVAIPLDAEPSRHLYVVRSRNRDALAAALAEQGVGTAVHYPTAIHLQPAFALAPGLCPSAEAACGEVLSLPIYPELADDEVDRVVGALGEWGRRTS